MKLTEDETLKGLARMQFIQANNPPSSKEWQRASNIIKHLANLLTDGKTKDACGRG